MDETHKIRPRYFAWIIAITLMLSITSLTMNTLLFEYLANIPLLEMATKSVFYFLLMYAGIHFKFGKGHLFTSYARELIYLLITWYLVILATLSTQLTPFSTIDQSLLTLDEASHTHLSNLLAWVSQHTHFQQILIYSYNSLPYQIGYLPFVLIATRRFELLREFYFLLLVTMIIGFVFYYFLPTMAPASVIDSPYFIDAQKATGLKFKQLHQHLPQTTHEGGLIALPSFHVIWAYLSLYLLRDWPVACWIVLPFNLLLALSCVLLGWHYPVDLFGSAVVIVIAQIALHYCYDTYPIIISEP